MFAFYGFYFILFMLMLFCSFSNDVSILKRVFIASSYHMACNRQGGKKLFVFDEFVLLFCQVLCFFVCVVCNVCSSLASVFCVNSVCVVLNLSYIHFLQIQITKNGMRTTEVKIPPKNTLNIILNIFLKLFGQCCSLERHTRKLVTQMCST